MANTNDIFNLVDLYQKYFGSRPFVVPGASEVSPSEGVPFKVDGSVVKSDQLLSKTGGILSERLNGVEIWLPVRFYDAQEELMYLPYSVVRISGKKTIVKTPMAERMGTVKEQYNIDDYSISIKGFLIDDQRTFPEDLLERFKALCERKAAVVLENALTNIFLKQDGLNQDEQRRVVILDFELPEVQGGRKHVRPFSMNIESDSIFTLEFEP